MPWSFRKPKPRPYGLSSPLLQLSRKREDVWTNGDAFEGCIVFGASGSGKSSSLGRTIALAFLDHGYGGIVACVKADEVKRWRGYAKQTGRDEDLIVVQPGGPHRLNILDYEYSRPGPGAGIADNVAGILSEVISLSFGGKSTSSSDPIWQMGAHNRIANAVDLVGMVRPHVRLEDISSIITSAPQSKEQVGDPTWRKDSLCWQCFAKAQQLKRSGELSEEAAENLEQCGRFWLEKQVRDPPKTRGSYESIIETITGQLLRAPFRRLFSTDTTFTPEMTFEGKIILMALPVKEYGQAGRIAQVLLKIIFQRAAERRITDDTTIMRPLFIFADEAHAICSIHDAEFLATARSARVSTVFITQNLPNLQAAYAGVSSQAMVEGLLGTFNTKVFHANGEPTTNRWAADLIAQTHRYRLNFGGGQSQPQYGQHPTGQHAQQWNAGAAQQLEHEVPPATFLDLKTGGPRNNGKVEAIFHQTARRWKATGKTYIKTEIEQQPRSKGDENV